MFAWVRRYREKQLARRKEQDADKVRRRISHEKDLERCKAGEHEWESDFEIQGDGDPNVEGYIRIIRSTCRVCGISETEIEPYNKNDE